MSKSDYLFYVLHGPEFLFLFILDLSYWRNNNNTIILDVFGHRFIIRTKIQAHEAHKTNNLTWTLITSLPLGGVSYKATVPFPHYIALYNDYTALNDKS
jgi:extradiol dioxygenase family protein